MNSPLKTIIVGAGHRSLIYASLAETKPEKMQIVGVVEPNELRKAAAAKRFNIPAENCFNSVEELANAPKFADAVINGTMDSIHVKTTLPLLAAGYDVLLEKPFAVNEAEARELLSAANKSGRKVMICFVLRYAPFYRRIKEKILAGEIGEILNIQLSEFVSYHHMSTSHVRGKWKNSDECGASMLLAKCCHDLDIMMWLMGDDAPLSISSFGCNKQFVKENAPENSGTRCMLDCPLVETCLYSAKRLYIDHPDRWSFYVWADLEDKGEATLENKIKALKTDSPYGVCAYKNDNNVVDHQSVMVNFASGATGTHNMIGGSSRGCRRIHITGTKGEIFGTCEDGKFTVLKIDPSPGHEYSQEVVDVAVRGDAHGGGDMLLSEDFADYVSGGHTSVSCTSLEDSMKGHLAVFLADKSRENGGAVYDLKV
ncbi:MAG: Gfo/Idh/MocA family oxidoreductase [Clostridia bacterium]|nr:Gfo/Idh/MocA family oxidoreductase [Clostridia bacterium]